MQHTQEQDVERQPLIAQQEGNSKKIFIIPVAIVVILAVTIPIAVVYSNSNTDTSGVSWMNNLHNETQLSRVSLPGTHNSGAIYGSANSQCQFKSLHEQLLEGIRFFDIHLYHYQNVLRVYQNMVDEHITFSEVQTTFVNYLTSYPSEIIIVRIKEEHIDYPGYVPPTDYGNNLTFAGRMTVDMAPFYSHYWHNSTYPTVGEVRGKIVPLCDYEGANKTCIDYNDIDDQDDYTIDSCDEIPSKFQGILHQIDYGLRSNGEGWYLNYASAIVSYHSMHAARVCTPRDIAAGINQRLYDYLKDNKTITYVGMVAMDFPYPALNQVIYRINPLDANSLTTLVYKKWKALMG